MKKFAHLLVASGLGTILLAPLPAVADNSVWVAGGGEGDCAEGDIDPWDMNGVDGDMDGDGDIDG